MIRANFRLPAFKSSEARRCRRSHNNRLLSFDAIDGCFMRLIDVVAHRLVGLPVHSGDTSGYFRASERTLNFGEPCCLGWSRSGCRLFALLLASRASTKRARIHPSHAEDSAELSQTSQPQLGALPGGVEEEDSVRSAMCSFALIEFSLSSI